ncbi:unnamed protein product [Dicrocoelium dendriticum]|nr:unnamed protein product [Dicrocoelium dendriticum]
MFNSLFHVQRHLQPSRLPFHKRISDLKQLYTNKNAHVKMITENPARELLNEWLVKSVLSEDEFDMDAFEHEPQVRIPSRVELKKEWDHLLKHTEEGSVKLSTKPTALSGLNYLTEKNLTSANGNRMQRVDNSSRNIKTNKENVFEKQASTGDTLHRILVRQEEARIRRVMRKAECEKQRQDTSVRREAAREALALIKQEEAERRRQLKREEELIQSEMVRIRKEMETEKERIARSRLKENEIPAKTNAVIPVLEQAGERPKPVASPTLLWANLENRSLSCTMESTVEDNMLLRHHFLNWRQTVVATRIQVATFAERRQCRLKRSTFRGWRSWSVEARLERELEKAKEFARELERKETVAVDLHETRLKRQGFENWHLNTIRNRMERNNADRKQVRQELETDFLARLREFPTAPLDEVCATEEKPLPHKSALSPQKEIRSSKASMGRANTCRTSCDQMGSVAQCTTFGTNRFRYWVVPSKTSARSAVERPSLAQTVLQQRQRIAAQNRQIEELKSAQRYTELMLEAKAHAMVDQLLLKASENTTQGSSSTTARSAADFTQTFHSWSHSAKGPNSASQFEPNSNENRCQEDPWTTPLPLDAINVNKNAFLRRMEENALKRARSRMEREERRRLAENRKKGNRWPSGDLHNAAVPFAEMG